MPNLWGARRGCSFIYFHKLTQLNNGEEEKTRTTMASLDEGKGNYIGKSNTGKGATGERATVKNIKQAKNEDEEIKPKEGDTGA